MVTAAWAWAGKTKNLRRNPVHGEEEARLVLTDKFEAQDTTTQETEMAGTIELEDRLNAADGARAEGLRDQIKAQLEKLQTCFDDLTKKQSDALTRPLDKPFQDSILKMFAEVTKQDLIMNNYIVRSRGVKPATGSAKSKAKTAKPANKDKKDKKEKKEKTVKKPKKEKKCLSMHEDDLSDDDDLANELLVGFQTGAESAERVVRIAQVASRKMQKQGVVFSNFASELVGRDFDEIAGTLIPFAVHGDEGRGKVKKPIMSNQLKEYPGGCGKGFDCGVMNGWLEEVTTRVQQASLVTLLA
ncbi:unnamed protein product [Symbiodinium microadriaticum]|nr:unnamed protein product [Symbiodinium microadriaticum]